MAAPNVCQPSAAHLASGRVNLAMLREAARREFLDLLDACAGSKAIVWDDQLTGPFGLIAEYSLLKEHEVDKMFALRSGQLPAANVQHIIFLLRPKLELMELVAENIREERDSGRREFSLVFVPRGSLLCEKQLKDLGVYGNLSHVKHFGLHLIPFDSDLLSMEAELSFRECCLESDYTSMFDVAKGIMTLQSLYGIIPEIHGKGDCARKVADMLQRMQRELGSVQSCIPSSIDSLVLLDRSVDLLTPLATQLTYEGLIDELYGVKNMYVKLPPEKFLPRRQGEGPQELPTEPKRLQLSSAEELHAEIRDRNFNAVGEALSRRARNITAAFEERHQARTVGEIKQFVSRLPHMQTIKSSLATHTAIAELIQEATRSESFLDTLAVEQEFISGIDTDKVHASIEELISQRQPLERVLRLMCMQSLCSGGLKPRTLDHYRREILQAYGFEHLSTLFNLEKVGLLRGQIGGRNPFPILRKSLRLQLSEVNEKTPNDISYVYSGYAPLSVRLVQFLARPGWRSIEEVLRLLPSPEVDERQPLPPGLAYKRGPGGGRDGESNQRMTLVFFLGGVTFAEVAALRFLAQTDDGNTDYIIGTTKLINGNTWLKSLMDTF